MMATVEDGKSVDENQQPHDQPTSRPPAQKKPKAKAAGATGASKKKSKGEKEQKNKAKAGAEAGGTSAASPPKKKKKKAAAPATAQGSEKEAGATKEEAIDGKNEQRVEEQHNKKEEQEANGERAEQDEAPPTLGEGNLLQWCQKKTDGYAGVAITDFSSSWRNGLAFCALVHRYCPQALDFSSLKDTEVDSNLKLAFGVAEKELGIPAYLSVEDVSESDGAEIMTYLLKFHSAVAEPRPDLATGSSSCIILEEAQAAAPTESVGAAISSICSSKPRLTAPKKATAGPGRRLPTRGVRPGDKLTNLKTKVDNVKATIDNTIYCEEGEPLSEEAVQKVSPRKRNNSSTAQSNLAQAAVGAGTASLRKASVTGVEKQPSLTQEGDVVIPAWKQKLIDKKREKAAAEAAPSTKSSDSKETQDDDEDLNSFMEGFLFKREGERWIRKWFVLNGPHLMYFADKRTEKNQLKPLAILSLELVSSVTSYTEKANAIEIADNANVKFHVYASTKEEYELWLDSLKAAHKRYIPVTGTVRRGTIVTAPSWSSIASAAKEGELLLMGGKGLGSIIGKKWKMGYFIVKDGFLEHLKTKGAKPTLRLPLLKCEFTEYEDKSQKHAFRVAATKKKLILAAPSLDEMHGWMNALLKQRVFMEEAMANISRASAASSTSLLGGSGEAENGAISSNRGRPSGRGKGTTDSKKGAEEAPSASPVASKNPPKAEPGVSSSGIASPETPATPEESSKRSDVKPAEKASAAGKEASISKDGSQRDVTSGGTDAQPDKTGTAQAPGSPLVKHSKGAKADKEKAKGKEKA